MIALSFAAMANFTTWTVCKHKPIEKLAPNLWRVSGSMPNAETQQRQMVLARMADGRVIVHNAVALDDNELAELEAWGQDGALAQTDSTKSDFTSWSSKGVEMRTLRTGDPGKMSTGGTSAARGGWSIVVRGVGNATSPYVLGFWVEP